MNRRDFIKKALLLIPAFPFFVTAKVTKEKSFKPDLTVQTIIDNKLGGLTPKAAKFVVDKADYREVGWEYNFVSFDKEGFTIKKTMR